MSMKGYKGFSKGLICRSKQYAENTVFEEEQAVICQSGLHFCENPLDVLDYYPLIDNDGELNEFAEVEALADVVTDDQKKYSTTKLRIGTRLGLKGFVEACVNFTLEKTAASGNGSQLAASGNDSQLAASGNYSQLAASGDYGKLAASGDGSKLAASGDYSQLAASGDCSIVVGIGRNNIAKASIGSWIVLAEWKLADGKYILLAVRAAQVDGAAIKADTFYTLRDGEFVEP